MSGSTPAAKDHGVPAGMRILNREYRVSSLKSHRPVRGLISTSLPVTAAACCVRLEETQP